jgi:gliding-associated putative ABC transporter substrate-binding component GldG
MKSLSRKTFTVLLVAAILVVATALSNSFFIRLDLSENQQFTLSQATRDILAGLESPVTIKAYFSEDLPPEFLRGRKQFKELLVEYAAHSEGMLVYEFINPQASEEIELEVVEKGVQPAMIDVREKDQRKQQKAYLGATIEMREETEVLPLIQPDGSMEYALSSAIRKLSATAKPAIGYIMGHGEPNLNELPQAMNELSVTYQVEPYFIAGGSVPGPDRFEAMLWIRPADTIPAEHFQFIDQYLALGGRLLVAFDAVAGDFVNFLGMPKYTGIREWLAAKSIEVKQNLVIDNRCGALTVQQSQGGLMFANNIPFPYLPLMRGSDGIAVSDGLEGVMMQFPSELRYTGDSTLLYQDILTSSHQSNTQTVPQVLDIQRQWTLDDYTQSHIPVAGAISGIINGSYSKMVVITDGEFIVNGPPQQALQLQPDNVRFFVNAVDWLMDDTGLIELRTRNVESRPLDPLSDDSKTWIKLINLLLPIVLVIIYGLIRYQTRLRLRKKRMLQDFSIAPK